MKKGVIFSPDLRLRYMETSVFWWSLQECFPACSLLFPGEVGLSQAQQEALVSGFVPGLPEALYVSGADQGAGAAETAQRSLSHQDTGQRQRVQVGEAPSLRCKN